MIKDNAGVVDALATVEEKVFPLALIDIGDKLVTVPPEPLAEMVIAPFPLVMVTPVPAVKFVLEKVPELVPISICPLVGVAVNPVPPFAILNADVNDKLLALNVPPTIPLPLILKLALAC